MLTITVHFYVIYYFNENFKIWSILATDNIHCDRIKWLWLYLQVFWKLLRMRHGATDSAKDYSARRPRFDSQQWISPQMAFFRKTTSPYILCNSFHYKKYLCNLRNWIKDYYYHYYLYYYKRTEKSLAFVVQTNFWLFWTNEIQSLIVINFFTERNLQC